MRLPRLLMASAATVALALAAAACSKSEIAPSTPAAGTCAVTLGAVTTSVGSGATSGTIPVTAPSTCAWTAGSSAAFLTISSGASGTGNGSVAYSIAANTGAARSASIAINGSLVNFVQAALSVQAPTGCSITLSTTSAKINSGGGTASIGVSGASNCGWTSTSNASFLTASSTGSGDGTATITAIANPSPAARTGTVTIGGQTVTVTQDPGVFASFGLFDPAQTAGATNVCQFRSGTGAQTTCTLRSTSFTSGPNAIVTYAWTVQYTYVSVKVTNASGSAPSLAISDTCGLANGGATDEGTLQPLDVTLTVTDSNGNTATTKSGTGSQPALFVQLFNCGK